MKFSYRFSYSFNCEELSNITHNLVILNAAPTVVTMPQLQLEEGPVRDGGKANHQ